MALTYRSASARNGDCSVAPEHERRPSRRLAGQAQIRVRRTAALAATRPAPPVPAAHPDRSAARRRTPGAGWGRARRRAVGSVEHSRVTVGRAQQHGDLLARRRRDVRRPRRRAWPCARTAAAQSRSAASPRRHGRAGTSPSTSRRHWSRCRSSATSPLPNTLTDASWPALSSRIGRGQHLVVGQPSSPSCARSRSLSRSSPEVAATRARSAPACSPRTPRSPSAPRPPPRAGWSARTSARWLATTHRSDGGRRPAHPSSSAITSTGSGSAKSASTSNAVRIVPSEQFAAERPTLGRIRSTCPRAKAADDLRRSRPCCGWLVLHHLVAVQEVERLEVRRPAPGHARSGRGGGRAALRCTPRG